MIHYDGPYDNNGIGTGAAASWICAARFTADDLLPYYGEYGLTDVQIHINGADFSNVTIKIFQGGTFGIPGPEIYSQDITGDIVAGDWTSHQLTAPIPLLSGNEYWIGYAIDATGGYPSSVDAGPAVAGNGDWMFFGGQWIEISTAFGLNFNWNIRGQITRGSGFWLTATPFSGTLDDGDQDVVTAKLDASMFSGFTTETAGIQFISDPEVGSTLIPVTLTVEGSVISIANARADNDGDFVPDMLGNTVRVTGIVTSPNYGSGMDYFIQDSTAGIQLYSYNGFASLSVGDEVQVTGEIDQYRGKTEIIPSDSIDIVVLSTGNPLPAAQVVTIPDVGEDYEAELIRINAVWLADPSEWPSAGSSGNVDLTDGTDTLTIRIDSDTDIDENAAPAGNFDLIGVGGQYTYSTPPDDGYQIQPRFYTDFMPPSGLGDDLPEIPTVFDLAQNYPNPFNPSTTIKYQLPENANVKIVIYNMLGQAVRTVVDKSLETGYHNVVWDGLNETGSRVATGIYFYRMVAEKFVKTHKMILMK